MRSFTKIALIMAVALMVFSLPGVVVYGSEIECFPFNCN